MRPREPRDERPWRAAPAWTLLAFSFALAAQLALQTIRSGERASPVDLPPAPRHEALRLASFGEAAAAARIAMLYLQAFDYRAGNAVPYQRLDYDRLANWLLAILRTDPRGSYPMFSAARIYAENPDPAKVRRMLEFIHQEFLRAPNIHWRWLAHAALLAKHSLGDLRLARRFAADVQRYTTDPTVPSWARQMEIFILEDMNELEAAKIMLGGLLSTGRITDPAEQRFLRERLEALERKTDLTQ